MEINGIQHNAVLTVKTKSLSGDVDIYNKPIYTYGEETVYALIGYTGTKTMADVDRDIVEETITVYLNGAPNIKSWDIIEYNNTQYVIDGDLEVWISPFYPNATNSVINIRRYDG